MSLCVCAHTGCFCALYVALRACLFTCSFCVLKGVNVCVPTRAVPVFKSNHLIDYERHLLQTKKNGSHNHCLKQYFSLLWFSLDFVCIHLVIRSKKELPLLWAAFFLYCTDDLSKSAEVFCGCSSLISVKRAITAISYSVIREGCVGYWQFLYTTEHIMAKMAGEVK